VGGPRLSRGPWPRGEARETLYIKPTKSAAVGGPRGGRERRYTLSRRSGRAAFIPRAMAAWGGERDVIH